MSTTGYTLIDEVNRLSKTTDWPEFIKRMANYIVKQTNLGLSELAQQPIEDELNSEIGCCPCGKGFVIDNIHNVNSFYYPTYAEPIILCSNCKQEFNANDCAYQDITMADEQDRTIKMINKNNNKLVFDTIIYPITLWKLISINGILN